MSGICVRIKYISKTDGPASAHEGYNVRGNYVTNIKVVKTQFIAGAKRMPPSRAEQLCVQVVIFYIAINEQGGFAMDLIDLGQIKIPPEFILKKKKSLFNTNV